MSKARLAREGEKKEKVVWDKKRQTQKQSG